MKENKRERERAQKSGLATYIELKNGPVRLGIDPNKAVLLVQRQKVHQPARGGHCTLIVDVRLAGLNGAPPGARRHLLRLPLSVASDALRPGEAQLHGRARQVTLYRRTTGRRYAAATWLAGRRPLCRRLPHLLVQPDVGGQAEAAAPAAEVALLVSSGRQVGGAGGGEAAVSALVLCGIEDLSRLFAVVYPLGVLAALLSLSWTWW